MNPFWDLQLETVRKMVEACREGRLSSSLEWHRYVGLEKKRETGEEICSCFCQGPEDGGT